MGGGGRAVALGIILLAGSRRGEVSHRLQLALSQLRLLEKLGDTICCALSLLLTELPFGGRKESLAFGIRIGGGWQVSSARRAKFSSVYTRESAGTGIGHTNRSFPCLVPGTTVWG
jgi:hypothetical protein